MLWCHPAAPAANPLALLRATRSWRKANARRTGDGHGNEPERGASSARRRTPERQRGLRRVLGPVATRGFEGAWAACALANHTGGQRRSARTGGNPLVRSGSFGATSIPTRRRIFQSVKPWLRRLRKLVFCRSTEMVLFWNVIWDVFCDGGEGPGGLGRRAESGPLAATSVVHPRLWEARHWHGIEGTQQPADVFVRELGWVVAFR
jgi:hypothetical protein